MRIDSLPRESAEGALRRRTCGLVVVSALLASAAGCGGDTLLATVDGTDTGADGDFSDDTPPDITWEGDTRPWDIGGERGEFVRETVEDAGPTDPWVPVAWVVSF